MRPEFPEGYSGDCFIREVLFGLGVEKPRTDTLYFQNKRLMTPIYKDEVYSFSGDTLAYSLVDGDNVFYMGKAYKFPGSDSGKINISRIAENYLYNDLPDLSVITSSTLYEHSGMTKTFGLYEGDTLLQTYSFVNDWSYDGLEYSGDTIMSSPVDGKVAPGMFRMTTTYSNNAVKTRIVPVVSSSDCGEWAIYYSNRKGGWDYYLLQGKVQESDDYERNTYERRVNYNERSFLHSTVEYRNRVSRGWSLNTGWLRDEEASNLATNLFPSNMVYLQNLLSGEIIPVVISDTSVEHKSFSITRKLISYEIKVKAANTEKIC